MGSNPTNFSLTMTSLGFVLCCVAFKSLSFVLVVCKDFNYTVLRTYMPVLLQPFIWFADILKTYIKVVHRQIFNGVVCVSITNLDPGYVTLKC